MKLEMKHLAPYLPYGLKWYDETLESTWTMRGMTHDTIIDKAEGTEIYDSYDLNWDGDKKSKPILRPLSDLTKEIEVGGHTVPLGYFLTHKEHFDKGGNYSGLSVAQYESLLRYHFDVFGLIPEGLAIDINTIK